MSLTLEDESERKVGIDTTQCEVKPKKYSEFDDLRYYSG